MKIKFSSSYSNKPNTNTNTHMTMTITTNVTNKINKRQQSTMNDPSFSYFDAATIAVAAATNN